LPKDLNKKIYRILDANLNRLQEGIRVCEEVVRFIFEEKELYLEYKSLRHRIKNILKALPADIKKSLIYFRDSQQDVGRAPSILENKRENIEDLFLANIQRSKESLRVLEEFLKLLNQKLSAKFKALRYRIYRLEKKTIARF
jgi:thiamine-phosphate pyrophosphorylase